MNAGFLIIQSSQADGSTVTVKGIPAMFDIIFKEQTMEYHMYEASGNETRRNLGMNEDLASLATKLTSASSL